MNKKLIIISIPFARLARNTLSDVILDILKENGDVLIVSPFGDNKEFTRTFSGENISFVNWNIKISRFKNLFFKIPDLMRRLGFIRKNRKYGLEYYFVNQYTEFGIEGNDNKFNFFKKSTYWILSVLGKNKRNWLFLEELLSFLLNDNTNYNKILDYTKNYKKVTLIQSANWGMQDRMISTLSKNKSWRKVFIPYTTDQLFANGYLINKFDAVCVQGHFEYDQAKKCFDIEKDSIFLLGSPWFRSMKRIQSDTAKPEVDKIIYAGISNLYFPRESEFKALDALIELVKNKKYQIRIIYRPVTDDQESKNYILTKYKDVENFEIDWPKQSSIGLMNFGKEDFYKSLKEYVEGLSGCRLLVMSQQTSLCKDVVFLENCPVISNKIDIDDMLKNRKNHLFPTHMLPGIIIINSVKDLVKYAEKSIEDPENLIFKQKDILEKWNFDNSDATFEKTLIKAVC